MTMFYAPLRGLQQAVETIIQLDDQMTSLSRVTGQTKEEMQSFFNESIELADQLSVKITDLNEAIIGFSRMGYRGNDLLDMAEAASIMSGVSDLNLEESMSRIVSAMQIFGIEAEDATDKIVSFMNEIDNNFAISTADLSDGLSKAGATANSFGVSMEETLGHITAIGEASRESGRIVGNSLKTIYSRITTMGGARDVLDSVGISIKDMNGEVRDVSDILEDLAGKWNTLSAEQQQNLGVTLAGRYQLSRFLLLMQNFDRSVEATSAALSSQNSAQDEYAKFLDSYTARINKMKNAFIELSITLERSFLGDGLKIGISSIENTTKATSELIETLGALPLAFGTLAVAIGALHPPTRTLIGNQTQLGLTTAKTGQAMVVTANHSKVMATAYTSASIAAQRLTVVMGAVTSGVRVLGGVLASIGRFLVGAALPVAGFMALGWAISKVTEKVMNHKEKQKELQQEQDKINKSYSSNTKEINKLANEYERLTNKVNSGELSESSQEYLSVQNRLNELMPILTKEVDEHGNARLRSVEAVKQELAYAERLKQNYEQTEIANFENELTERAEKVKDIQNEIDRLNKAQTSGYASRVGSEQNLQAQRDQIANERELQQLLSETNDYVKSKSNTYLSNSGATNNLNEASQKLITTFIDENNEIEEAIKNGESYEDVVGSLVNDTTDFGETLAKFNSLVETGSHVWIGMIDELKGYGLSTKEIYKYVEEMTNRVDDNTDALVLNEEALAELDKRYKDATDSISSINKYLEEYQENNSLSADSINKIVQEYPDLIQYMNDEEALIEQLKQKRIEESNVATDVLKTKLMNDENYYKTTLNANQDYFEGLESNYKVDFERYKNLEQAKGKLSGELLKELSKSWGEYFGATAKQLSSFFDEDMNLNSTGSEYLRWLPNDQKKKLIDEWGSIKEVVDGFNDISMPEIDLDFNKIGLSSKEKSSNDKGSRGSSSSKNDPDKVSLAEFIEADVRAINSQNDSLEENNRQLKDRLENTEDYNEQLNLTNELIKGQEKQIDSLRVANNKLHEQANQVRDNSGFDTLKWFDAEGELTRSYYEQYDRSSKQAQEKMSETAKQLQLLKNAYQSNQEEIKELVVSNNIDLVDNLDEINKNIIKEKMDGYETMIQGVNNSISKVQKEMSLLDENSEDYVINYTNLTEELNNHLQYKATLYNNEIKYLESLGNLTDEQESKLSSLKLSLMDVQLEVKRMTDDLNKRIADILSNQKDQHLDKLREDLTEKEENKAKALNDQSDLYDVLLKQYDDQIAKQEEKLKNLDEEYQKEDRLKRLREIDEKLANARKDKRFSYITEDGQEILTYNKELVDELEKERDELVKQYDREDVKKSIQNDIDRYEKAKEERIRILRNELEEMKQRHKEQLEEERDKWEDIILAANNGTLNYDKLMNGDDGWYSRTLQAMRGFGIELENQVQNIKTALEGLNDIKLNDIKMPSVKKSPSYNGGSYSPAPKDKGGGSGSSSSGDGYGGIGGSWDGYWKETDDVFHDGGIIGGSSSKLAELTNKIFNLKPNERIVKALKGEVMIPQSNLSNGFGNIKNMVNSIITRQQPNLVTENHYHLKDFTVKTDNAKGLFDSIHLLVRSNQG